ncbi:unnamed protein product, partial [Ascophyllum nodosum]
RDNSLTRSYTSMLEDFVILAGQVHKFGPDRSENMRPMEMAVNLLRCRRQE